MEKAVFTTNPITGIEYYHGILDVTESFNRCCELAKEIVKSGWMNSLNPMVRELTNEADQHGISISFDDAWIAVEDEMFYTDEEIERMEKQ